MRRHHHQRNPHGSEPATKDRTMGRITVGTENSTPIELYYEDQGTGSLQPAA